jgi:predicted CoA-binding protein
MPIEDDDVIRRILESAKTIAVVGASVKPWRDSNSIMQFLLQVGYIVFPVNPNYSEVLGTRCVPLLSEVSEKIDIVDVFRRSDAVGPIVDEAIAVAAKTLWMQVGVVNEEAADKAERAGLNVIMDRCIRVDYQRLIR